MKRITLIVVLTLVSQLSKAQGIENIILAADDASKLTENYISPVVKGLMYNMNGGWYATGRVHQKYGFDISITANLSYVPSADEIFQFIPSDYEFVSLPNGDVSLPTVLSSDDSEATVDVSVPNPTGDGTFRVASFQMPGGIAKDLPAKGVPTPMVQFGLGLPLKTDLKLRFVPKTFISDFETNLIGIGIQHDLMQYFKEPEYLPLFVSLLGAFTHMKVGYSILDTDASDNLAITNGAAEFKMDTWTIQAVGSLNYKYVTIYAGLGYNGGTSSINVKGDYDVTYDVEDSSGTTNGTVEQSFSNPVNLSFETYGPRATLGTRFNLGLFRIFGDYTLQEYNTLSAGIAYSFR